MEKTLRNYALAGVKIKRFTYLRNGQLVQAKPKTNEVFVLHEDYLGDRSIIWICCFNLNTDSELWRHNVCDAVRLTYDSSTT
jgi:hypothetical protein